MGWLDTPLTTNQILIGEPLILLALALFVLLPAIHYSVRKEEKRREKRKAEKAAVWGKMNDGVRR